MREQDNPDLAERKVYLLAFPASLEESALNFRRILEILRRVAFSATVAGAATALLAVAATFAAPRWYRSQVVLMPVSADSSLGALGGLAGSLGGLAGLAGIRLDSAGSNKDESLAVLRSREFSERFIVSHGLLERIFERKWDGASKRWKDEGDAPTLEEAFRYFDRKVRRIDENRSANTVTVTIEWKDPVEAAVWANALASELNEYARRRAIDEASQSLGYLKRELGKSDDLKLRENIYKLMQDQLATTMLANVRQEYAFRIIDPAKVPDRTRSIRPRRVLVAVLAFMVGALFATIFALRRTADRS